MLHSIWKKIKIKILFFKIKIVFRIVNSKSSLVWKTSKDARLKLWKKETAVITEEPDEVSLFLRQDEQNPESKACSAIKKEEKTAEEMMSDKNEQEMIERWSCWAKHEEAQNLMPANFVWLHY